MVLKMAICMIMQAAALRRNDTYHQNPTRNRLQPVMRNGGIQSNVGN